MSDHLNSEYYKTILSKLTFLTGDFESRMLKEACFAAAYKATCKRDKCGAVIFNGGHQISHGFNHPPANYGNYCNCQYLAIPPNNKHDITCCVHAEQDAIKNALLKYRKDAGGFTKRTTLYFARFKENELQPCEHIYCVECAKVMLEYGIKFVVLYFKHPDWNEPAVVSFNTKDYLDISYLYYWPQGSR